MIRIYRWTKPPARRRHHWPRLPLVKRTHDGWFVWWWNWAWDIKTEAD